MTRDELIILGCGLYLEPRTEKWALVALDTKTIGYIKACDVKQTMFFLPESGQTLKASTLKQLSEYGLEQCLT